MGIVSPVSGHPPMQEEPKELKTFPLEIHDSRLLLVEFQSPPFLPALQSPQHLRTLPFPAHDNKVIRIAHHHRCLYHPIPSRRDAQRPFLPIAFRDIHSANGLRAVGFSLQLFFKSREPMLPLPRVDLEFLHPHSVHSGRSPVDNHHTERSLKNFPSAHTRKQKLESTKLLSAQILCLKSVI